MNIIIINIIIGTVVIIIHILIIHILRDAGIGCLCFHNLSLKTAASARAPYPTKLILNTSAGSVSLTIASACPTYLTQTTIQL